MALSQTHCAVPDKETLQDSCQWCSTTVGVHHAPLGMAMHPWVQSHVPRAAGPSLCAATTPVWQGSHPVAMAQQGAQCRPGALPQHPFLQFLKPWRFNTKNDSRAVMLWIGTPKLPSHLSTHPCIQVHPRTPLSPGRVPGAAWGQQSQRAASLLLSAASCFVVLSTAQHTGAISGHGWVDLPAPRPQQPQQKVPPQCQDVSVSNLSPTLPRGVGLPLSTLLMYLTWAA